MAVLVSGGAGYIGSHMAHALCDAGERVVVVDDLSTGQRASVPAAATFVQADIADQDAMAETLRRHQVTAIAHFAARIVVPDSVADPLGYYLANTVKTRALIDVAVAGGVGHFIFSSTAAVYGDAGDGAVDEDATLAPVSPYGRSKLMSEWMLQDAGRAHGLKYAALRYFNVAGADPQGRTGQSTPNATHLIKVACQAALGKRDRLQVFGTNYPTSDGSCVRDYIHVTDLADAHVQALRYLRSGGDSFTANCGYGRGLSVLEVIRAVEQVTGRALPVEIAPRRAGDPARIVASPARIQSLLDWRPRHDSIDEIVGSALNWEQRLGD